MWIGLSVHSPRLTTPRRKWSWCGSRTGCRRISSWGRRRCRPPLKHSRQQSEQLGLQLPPRHEQPWLPGSGPGRHSITLALCQDPVGRGSRVLVTAHGERLPGLSGSQHNSGREGVGRPGCQIAVSTPRPRGGLLLWHGAPQRHRVNGKQNRAGCQHNAGVGCSHKEGRDQQSTGRFPRRQVCCPMGTGAGWD